MHDFNKLKVWDKGLLDQARAWDLRPTLTPPSAPLSRTSGRGEGEREGASPHGSTPWAKCRSLLRSRGLLRTSDASELEYHLLLKH